MKYTFQTEEAHLEKLQGNNIGSLKVSVSFAIKESLHFVC